MFGNKEDIFFEEEEDGIDENGWAVSYGDVMSLLLAFFVMMMSTATVNQAKYDEIKKYLSGDVQSVNDLEKLEKEIKNEIESSGLGEMTKIQKDTTGVEVVIKNDLLFQPGEAKLSIKGRKIFKKILNPFSKINKKYKFAIEGHTDNQPVHNREFDSNWDLSTARAVSVLKIFINQGFDESRFSVQGFADQKPIVKNRDSKGRPIIKNMAKNRRVVIKIR